MASKTIFTIYDIKNMLSLYEIGEVVDFMPISNGTVQTNYIVTTTHGKYVLKYYESRNFKQVQFEISLLKILMHKNFPCVPVISSYTENLCTYNEKPYVIFDFIDAEHVEYPNKKQLHSLINLIADLLKITQSLKLDYSEERLTYSKTSLTRLVREFANRINTENAYKKMEWYVCQINALELPQSLPMGICHCDYHFTNLFYSGDDIKALIDFDDANYTYLFFDIISIIDFFKPGFNHETWNIYDKNDDIFDFTEAKEYIDVFEKKFPIPINDKIYFYDILKLTILIDCLWYFERGSYKDFFEKRKIEALNQMGRRQFYNQLFRT